MFTVESLQNDGSFDVLNILMDIMSDGLAVLDASGKTLYVNSKGLDILGMSQEECLDYFSHDSPLQTISEDGTSFRSSEMPASLVLKTGQRQVNKIIGIPAHHGDGIQWLQVSAYPLRKSRNSPLKGVVETFSDVTELVRNRHRIQQEDENLKLLSQNLPGMIHELEVAPDGQMRSIYASPSSIHLYELAPDEIIEDFQLLLKMLDPKDLPAFHQMIRRGVEAPHDTHRSWTGCFTLPSGAIKWVLVRFSVRRLANGSTRFHALHLDVTKQVLLEKELQLSQERFELAVHGSNSGIWDWDLRTNQFWFSDMCLTMLGHDHENFDKQPKNYLSLAHPEDLGPLIKKIQDTLAAKKETVQTEVRALSSNGSYRWIQLRGNLTYDSNGTPVRANGWNIDVHDQKTLNQRLELITSTIEEVFWIKDPTTDQLIYVSPGYEKIWRDSIQRIQAKPKGYLDCIHPADLKKVLIYNDRQKTQECQERYRIIWPNRAVRWIQDRAFPVRDHRSSIQFVICVTADITHEVETAELLTKQQNQVINAAKMSALGLMAAGVSHEINNPLAIISGRSQEIKNMISRGQIDLQKLSDISDGIDRTAHRIAKIIRGLRTFARDAEGDPMERVPLGSIIEDTLSLCQSRFAHRGIHLHCQPADRNWFLQCRPSQISQLLLNLLNNAFDAVEESAEKSVWIEIKKGNSHFEIRVIDSGPGIPISHRPKIMQPFFTTKAVDKGTGLGLSIVEGLAKAHGGSFWLEETHPRTCFVVQLPSPP